MADTTAPLADPRPHDLAAIDATTETMACTVCDALQNVHDVDPGQRLTCIRCGTTLLFHEGLAIDQIIAASLAMSILLLSAVFLPFLQISASGLRSAASLLDTALAFSGGITAPLTVAVFLVIVVIPIFRAILLIYTLLPVRLGSRPLYGARLSFRIACELRPWAMAEVFIIGVAVALVKIGGMATVAFGPAFWELALIVLIVVFEGGGASERTLWRMLEKNFAR